MWGPKIFQAQGCGAPKGGPHKGAGASFSHRERKAQPLAEDGFEPTHLDHETNKLTVTLFREVCSTGLEPVTYNLEGYCSTN